MADRTQAGDRIKYLTFRDIGTMNSQSARQGLDPKNASWLENLQPIGPNQLLAVPGLSSALSTLPATVSRAFFATFTANGGVDPLNIVDWVVVFTTAGSGHVINLGTGAVTNFAAAGTFSNFPDAAQWKSERVLIADSKAGYSTYDNSTFARSGTVSPNITVTNGGSGYGSPPSVTISGGSGGGATAISVISAGVVTGVFLTNPGSGYQTGDTLTVTFGSGTAAATAHIWPQIGSTSTTISSFIPVTNPGHYYYPSVPNVVISGGSGSGATATASISNGQVIGITLTNPGSGWQPADVLTVTIDPPPASIQATATITVQMGTIVGGTITNVGFGYTSTPNVVVNSATGSGAVLRATTPINSSLVTIAIDNAGSGYLSTDTVTIDAPPARVTATATATVISTKGLLSTLAVFQGRVWLGAGRLLQFTGTGGYDDFNPANAAGQTTITDSDLSHRITGLRSLNNYLYIFGDTSIKQIGTITVSGSTTLFTILTLSSDQGTTYPLTIQSYDRLVLFANTTGVFAVYGASVQKISDMMDGVFRSVNFALDLQAAVADVNNIRVYTLLVSAVDYRGVRRSLFLTHFKTAQGLKWFVISGAGTEIAVVTTLTGNSRQIFKSSGTDFTQMLAATGATVSCVLQTALADAGRPEMGKKHLRAGFMHTATLGGNVTINSDTEQNSIANVVVAPNAFFWGATQTAGSGLLLGATYSFVTTGLSLNYLTLEYEETGPMKSSNLTN